VEIPGPSRYSVGQSDELSPDQPHLPATRIMLSIGKHPALFPRRLGRLLAFTEYMVGGLDGLRCSKS